MDIGFTIVRRDEVLSRLPADGNPSFEAAVYPALIADGRLGAYTTDHRYYSVGSLGGCPRPSALAFTPAVVLDRDSVLNACPPRARCVTNWSPSFTGCPGREETCGCSRTRASACSS